MKARLVTILVLLAMMFSFGGCGTHTSDSPAATSPITSNETTNIPTSDPEVEARLVDQTWISPAMVQIANYYPGAEAEWFVRMHNGGEVAAEFLISYREPNQTKEGYTMPPPGAQDWIIIADPAPVLASKETREISIVLAVPGEVEISSKKWEFWISVIEQGQGMVQTEMCSRWLVSMR